MVVMVMVLVSPVFLVWVVSAGGMINGCRYYGIMVVEALLDVRGEQCDGADEFDWI